MTKERPPSYTPAPQLPTDPELRKRFDTIVAVLAETQTVTGAASSLGLSRNRFQTILHRVIAAMLEEMMPKPAGRPAKPERETVLEKENEELRAELADLQSRTEMLQRVMNWPGPKAVAAFLNGRVLKARRPKFLFREDGPMPEEVEITLAIPPELGDHDEIVARVRAGIAAVEDKCGRERAQMHRQVLGRRRILRQSWRDNPTSREPRRNLRPRVAARNKWARIEKLRRNKQFPIEYRDARLRWVNGDKSVIFPAGTYWLRRFAKVPTESIHPPLPIRTSK